MFDDAFTLGLDARTALAEIQDRLHAAGLVTHFAMQMRANTRSATRMVSSESYLLDMTSPDNPLSLLEPTRLLLSDLFSDDGCSCQAQIVHVSSGHRDHVWQVLRDMSTPPASTTRTSPSGPMTH